MDSWKFCVLIVNSFNNHKVFLTHKRLIIFDYLSATSQLMTTKIYFSQGDDSNNEI